MQKPSLESLIQTYFKIKPFLHKTPILRSSLLDSFCKTNIYFKCENLQKSGSFKARGATNAILSLSSEQKKFGVVTHSSGNHGGALARMARLFNTPAYIVMPSNSSEIKKSYVLSQNAQIIESKATIQSREETAAQIQQKYACDYVHPYNDLRVISGQSTCYYEFFSEVQDFDYILAPVGGGGLLSGTCLMNSYISPKTKVIGVEPYLARDAYLSLQSGRIEDQLPPITIADGVRVNLGTLTFPIIKQYCDQILLVEEEEIKEATNLMWKIMKIIVEPTSALVLAAIKKNASLFEGRKVGAIITGGNVDIVYK